MKFEITESEPLKSLKTMKNDKSAGNDGLTKEFLEPFGNKLKHFFFQFQTKIFFNRRASQKQAVIKLNEKKTGIKD